MTLVLSVGLLAACGNDGKTNSSKQESSKQESSKQDSSASDDSSGINTAAEDIIGEISYIASSYISLTVYETAAGVSDYASLDVSTLTATDSMEDVTLETDAEYYYISDASMVSQPGDELAVGDLIAVTTTEEGLQQIILLRKGAEGSDAANADNDIVAKVTAVDGDTLTLTIYEAVETASAITDYTQVNLENYVATDTEENYAVDSTISVSVIQDGVMTITDSSEIVVGDMLVIYTAEDGTPSVAVYHAVE